MLKFMYDHKGALSLFTLLLLLPLIIISSLMIDFARAKAAEAQAAAAAETYANSYLSVYDELLNELYGLFAVTQTDTAVLDELKEYMTASFTPGSKDEIRTANTHNSEWFGTEYPDALALMGSSLNSMEARPAKPLVLEQNGTKNYNTLQMQISEYTKFIGPTDLIATGIQSLIKPDDNGQDTKDRDEAESAIANTNKNYGRIQKKEEIDDLLLELNVQINNLYNAMHDYDDAITKYFFQSDDQDSVTDFGLNTYMSYTDAINSTNYTLDQFKELCNEIVENHQEWETQQNSNNNSDGSGDDTQDGSDTDSNDPQDNDTTTPQQEEEYDLGDFKSRLEELRDYRYKVPIRGAPYYEHDDLALSSLYFTNSVKGIRYGFLLPSQRESELLSYFEDCKEVSKVVGQSNIESGYMQRFIVGGDIYRNVSSKRDNLSSAANDMTTRLGEIRSSLKSLMDDLQSDVNNVSLSNEERDSAKKFLDGIKEDYGALIFDDDRYEGSDMWVIANFNYSHIASDFNTHANNVESNIQNDMRNMVNSLCPKYDTYISNINTAIYDKITDILEASESGDPFDKVSAGYDWAVRADMDKIDGIDERSNYLLLINNLKDYGYYSFDDSSNTMTDNGAENISYYRLYSVLKNWNVAPTEEKQNEKEELEDLPNQLNNALSGLKFDNIKLRGSLQNKIMPSGSNETVEDKGTGGFTEVPSLPSAQEMGEKVINKLLLIIYDYGMFTCQTSDKKEDGNEINSVAPISYQGITLASGDKLEDSTTNFLLYGELEYIFQGNIDPEMNFRAVRDSLSIIRFVPNYISTYTIDPVNAIIKAVESALSWCPIAAIVAGQLLRIAIAGVETWCDLDMLYGGYSVRFYKNELGDLSMFKKLENTDIVSKFEDLSGEDLSSESSGGISNININYQQYLILLSMIFVDSETMLERTSDLIEVNMNYYINGSTVKHQIDLLGNTITTDNDTVSIDKFHMTSANTAVEVTCNVKRDFIFTGKVFNFRNAGYDNVADFADEMNGTESSISSYPYVAVKEY